MSLGERWVVLGMLLFVFGVLGHWWFVEGGPPERRSRLSHQHIEEQAWEERARELEHAANERRAGNRP